uniref:NADH-ubiquinone oxidoreductase chain 4 n=1 Tax=Nectoneanthes multignatha TaxID=3070695 RepID=A0AA50II60_9ANNE|nr:NADH dehydrogenase subunit 4 [Nectoneanthes multignatha]WLW41624.1 NADH dehydrogenase subunit 4 [Nectoneanthes multignatha]
MLKLITPFVLLLIYKPEWNKTMLFMSWMVMPATLIVYCSQSSTPINMMLFTDQMSNMLVILTLWIMPLVLAASQNIMINKYQSKFTINIISLTLILITAFMVSDLFSFYIMFEASLIPTLFIIMKWGYQPERLQAGLYLMMYTITASLPLLMGIAFQYNKSISNMFFTMYPSSNSISVMWLMMNLAFMVKLPLFLFHLWLPKAHVEAPVAGSMILAAVLLKLGGYGMLRVMYMISPVSHSMKYYLLGLTLWGGMITSLICVRQQDLKSLIAYSSVGHMSLVMAGVLSNIQWGIWGAISMMIAHGLLSSALFASADMAYSMSNSRSLLMNKGINILMPTMSMLWFIMSAANMAAPPSANLMAEIMLITCSTITSKLMIIPVGIMSFVAAAYSLTMYVSMNHGPLNQLINPSMIMIPRNFMVIMSHIIPVVLVMLMPTLITIY